MAIPIDWTIPQSYLDQSKEIATLRARVAELEANEVKLRNLYDYVAVELHKAEVERDRLREALHRISLASQNSMSSKGECGRIARAALEGEQ